MLEITYAINGAKFRRSLPDTAEYRAWLWKRAAILITEGMRVTIRNR